MLAILIPLLLLSPIFSQFANELFPISNCLGNCLHCEHNELEVCSTTGVSDENKICMENFHYEKDSGDCVLDAYYQGEIALLSSSGEFKKLQKWDSIQSVQCSYTHANRKQKNISVLGLFKATESNTLRYPIEAYYQSLLLTFNLVRNSWVPYSDFLQIEIKDQNNASLGKHIIEYLQRQNYLDGGDYHTIKCQEHELLVEKYELQVDFRHKNITKIYIEFTGLMYGEELWGLTNFRLAFGCQNNLFFNGLTCEGCEPGFYLDTELLVNGAHTCHECQPNCLSCSKEMCFTCAEGMRAVDSHCQAGPGFKLVDKIYHPNTTVCGIIMLHSSQSGQLHKQVLSIQNIKIPQKHSNLRLIFDLYLTDTQWNNNSALIIEIDGRQVKRVTESKIHNRLRQRCGEFREGYFSRIKIVTPYFQHTRDEVVFRIYSADTAVTDFGISDVNVEIQLDYSVDPVKNDTENATKSIKEQQKMQQPKPQPQPVPQSPPPIPQQSSKTASLKTQISKILPQLQHVTLSHNTISNTITNTNSGQLLIQINYPVEIQAYPYIYCKFEKIGVELPGRMTGSTNHLQFVSVGLRQSLVNETVVVVMAARERGAVSKQRGLQEVNVDGDVELGTIRITRFDVLDINQISSITSLRVLFITFTLIFLVLTIVLLLLGKGSLITDLSLLLQFLFLHIYINSEFQPHAFKLPASGFQNMENLNFFTEGAQKKIENWLLGGVVQESPIRFTEFNTDVNFSRGVYAIVAINVVFGLWFLGLMLANRLIKRKVKQIQADNMEKLRKQNGTNPQLVLSPQLTPTQSQPQQPTPTKLQKLSVFLSGITQRPINYWYFILKYQFLSVIWLCLLQFYGFAYPKPADRNETINAIFCILAFVCCVCWPVGVFLWVRYQYGTMEYEEYRYQYQHVFYLQLHAKNLPSNHHQYYILLQYVRYLVYAICCSYLGNSPIQSLTILILVHILSLAYLKVGKPLIHAPYIRFFYLQYILLIVLQVLMLVAYGVGERVSKREYLVLGYFMVAVSILGISIAGVRGVYVGYRMAKAKGDGEEESTCGDHVAHRIV